MVAVLGGVATAMLIGLAAMNQHASCMWNDDNKAKYYEEEVRTPASKEQRR